MKVVLARWSVWLVVAVPSRFWCCPTSTALADEPAVKAIGVSTPVTVQLANPHGVRRVDAYLEQNGARYPLFEQSAPAAPPLLEPARSRRARVTFEAGKNKAPNLKEGQARLVVEAVSNDLRGQHRSPRLRRQRGADAAARDARRPAALHQPGRHGTGDVHRRRAPGARPACKVGKYTFRSFPLPGQPRRSASPCSPIPGICRPTSRPWSTRATRPARKPPRHFWFKLFPKKFRVRDFRIDDALMEKLVNSVDPTGTDRARARTCCSPLPLHQRRAAPQEQPAACRPALQDRREDPVERPVPPLGQGGGQFRRRAQLHLPRQEGGPAGAPGLRSFRHAERAGEGRQRRPRGVGLGPGHLRQLHRAGPRLRRCNRSTATCARST